MISYSYQKIGITPVAKPRMTQRDKWRKRLCVLKYRAYADELRIHMRGKDFPGCGYHLIFVLPMPKSWSKKKRENHRGRAHMQKPDKDNLEKAFLDALMDDDAGIWDGRVSKVWGDEGAIYYCHNALDYSFLSTIYT